MTAPMVRHYLMTRFATSESFARHVRKGPVPLSDEWIERRFELFERYCLPSVQAQSAGAFTWLLFVDGSFYETLRPRLGGIDPRVVIMSRGYNPFPLRADCDVLITTRLDSDDALAPNAVAYAQDRAGEFFESGKDVHSLSYIYGYQVDDATGRVWPSRSLSLFLTMFERAAVRQQGVYSAQHNQYRARYETELVKETGMFLRVSHGGNAANGRLPDDSAPLADADEVAPRFPFLYERAGAA